jgi:hypothetical protein
MGAFRACLGKIGRREFIHQPLVRLMRPDGSVVTARCAEPRHLVQLPLNLAKLSDDQRRIVVAGRRGTVQRKREVSYFFHFLS